MAATYESFFTSETGEELPTVSQSAPKASATDVLLIDDLCKHQQTETAGPLPQDYDDSLDYFGVMGERARLDLAIRALLNGESK